MILIYGRLKNLKLNYTYIRHMIQLYHIFLQFLICQIGNVYGKHSKEFHNNNA